MSMKELPALKKLYQQISEDILKYKAAWEGVLKEGADRNSSLARYNFTCMEALEIFRLKILKAINNEQ